ncbi:MAG: nucleotidyltransferase domain-containing protein [Pseudomonadota bacterium]
MVTEQNQCLKKVILFVNLLRQHGVDVSEAYLFGSVVNGMSDKESDIDVAIVSKDFQGIPFYDMQKISKWRRQVDLHLEIHPFALAEIETDPPLFFTKIRRDGLRIEQEDRFV